MTSDNRTQVQGGGVQGGGVQGGGVECGGVQGMADDCEHVLEQVYQFIDHELDTASSDAIRQHLVACEPCLEHFDVEQAVKSLVFKCCGGETAPNHLRDKVLGQLAAAKEQARRS